MGTGPPARIAAPAPLPLKTARPVNFSLMAARTSESARSRRL